MLLDLGDNMARLVPRHRLKLKVVVDTPHTFWRTTHRALDHLGGPALENTIGAEANGRR